MAREPPLQLLDAFALFFRKRERWQECARFDEKQGRGHKNELRGLSKRKAGKLLDVRKVGIRYVSKTHLRNGELALLDEVEERIKWPRERFCRDGEAFTHDYSESLVSIRCMSRGKAVASLTLASSSMRAVKRSSPVEEPPCGGSPYLKACR